MKFSIPGFFWLVYHLRGDFLRCHSYVIDETEDVLGCPEYFLGFVGNPRDLFFFGGGEVILSSFDKWSNYVHSCISGTHGVKETLF